MSDETDNDASDYGGRYSGFDSQSDYAKYNPETPQWSGNDVSVNLPQLDNTGFNTSFKPTGNRAQDAATMMGLGPINGSLTREQVKALQEGGFGDTYGGNLNNLEGQTVDQLGGVYDLGDSLEKMVKGLPIVRTAFQLPALFGSFFDKQEGTTPKAVGNTLSSLWGPAAAAGHLMNGRYAEAAGSINPFAGAAVNAFQNGPTQGLARQVGGTLGGMAGSQLGYQSGNVLGNLFGGRIGQAVGSNLGGRGFNSLQGKSLSNLFK